MRLELYWIPLGAGERAGQRVVRVSGRIFETVAALAGRRPRCGLFHAALVATFDAETIVIEMAPMPDNDGQERRGVVAVGAVGLRQLGRFRIFRYEVRRWSDGTIPDLDYAVESPVLITMSPTVAHKVIGGLAEVPTPVWGRDELNTGEMWNSNSVIAWALARHGLDARAGDPPNRGRAPGWASGVAAADQLGVGNP